MNVFLNSLSLTLASVFLASFSFSAANPEPARGGGSDQTYRARRVEKAAIRINGTRR